VTKTDVSTYNFGGLDAHLLVFIDGRFAANLSSASAGEPNLRFGSLRDLWAAPQGKLQRHLARHARTDDNGFVALNTAFLQDGAFVFVEAGGVVEKPIHILNIASGISGVSHSRNLIILERGAQAKVIESYLAYRDAAYLTNVVTEMVLEQDALLEHCKVQRESKQAYHVAAINSYQERSSNLLTHSVSIGALLARNTITSVLDGQHSQVTMNGLYIASENQLVDHHTAIHHAKPNCPSHEYYHGILDGKAQGVFNGKIFVRPEAQKTDAKQTNRNLLLSDEAVINTKPQLEIFADDVKCTHGATIGQLEPNSLFYLRARGIPLEKARKILIHAFATEIINRITIEPIRQELDAALFELYEKD